MTEKKKRKTFQEFYARIHLAKNGEKHLNTDPVKYYGDENHSGSNHGERRS